MLSRVANALRRAVAERLALPEKAGVDIAGNRYFRQPQVVDGVESERRWVKYNGHPDPRILPVEWTSWLSHTRPDAPSLEEIEMMDSHRKMVKYKASIIQAEEEKRRFRAMSLKQGAPGEEVRPESLEKVMQHISEGGVPSQVPDPSKQKGAFSEPTRDGGIFKPGYWQPPDDARR